ncbi:Zn-dependent hydrolase [Anopheles sinensis]|uniref:Zn-dependent hydrolase n=1 Tax=Anopheles sinensis TaxID=74873 RepID=A0A084VQA7_ANOSI|nr:Zn-dependent hydrolase [Anopheles sinensis]
MAQCSTWASKHIRFKTYGKQHHLWERRKQQDVSALPRHPISDELLTDPIAENLRKWPAKGSAF